jgi:hypothetical protein
MSEFNSSDIVAYFEMAKIALAVAPAEVADNLCLSDEEFMRLRDNLHQYMNDDSDESKPTISNGVEIKKECFNCLSYPICKYREVMMELSRKLSRGNTDSCINLQNAIGEYCGYHTPVEIGKDSV